MPTPKRVRPGPDERLSPKLYDGTWLWDATRLSNVGHYCREVEAGRRLFEDERGRTITGRAADVRRAVETIQDCVRLAAGAGLSDNELAAMSPGDTPLTGVVIVPLYDVLNGDPAGAQAPGDEQEMR